MFNQYQKKSDAWLQKKVIEVTRCILRCLEKDKWYLGSQAHKDDIAKLQRYQKELEVRAANLRLPL